VFAMQGRSLVAGGITLSLFSLAGALGGMVGGIGARISMGASL